MNSPSISDVTHTLSMSDYAKQMLSLHFSTLLQADRREDFLTHLQSMLEEVQTLQRQRFSVEKITRKGEVRSSHFMPVTRSAPACL